MTRGQSGKNTDIHSKIIMNYWLCGRSENQYTNIDKFHTHLCSLTPVSTIPHSFMIADIDVNHSYLQYLFYFFQFDDP